MTEARPRRRPAATVVAALALAGGTPVRGRLLPWAVVALVVAGVLVGTFALPPPDLVEPVFNRLAGIAFALVGALATRRPEGRRIGWVCLAIGFSSVTFDVAAGYAATVGPGAVWAYWVGEWTSLVQPVLALAVLPAWFPTGRPLGPRWRWIVPSALGLLVLGVLAVAVAVDTYEVEAGVLGPNPLAVPALASIGEAGFVFITLAALGCGLAALGSMGVRFRRARGVERLQLRWLLVALCLLLLLVVGTIGLAVVAPAGVADGPRTEMVIDALFGVAVLLLPTAIGIALTRYRLYDLDRLVSRTVGYSVVLAVLAGCYLGLVVGLGAAARALTGESGDLVVALSTLAVAALFQPVRRRVQRVVDRRFNRARYDATRTVEEFGRSLRDEVSRDAVVGRLRDVATDTVRPTAAGVLLVGEVRS